MFLQPIEAFADAWVPEVDDYPSATINMSRLDRTLYGLPARSHGAVETAIVALGDVRISHPPANLAAVIRSDGQVALNGWAPSATFSRAILGGGAGITVNASGSFAQAEAYAHFPLGW